ncbi:hypothetical protein [Chromatium okenii]|jgi:hypothetical protein|uniref:hypothetical protein n=1 Tax=Chromatium okenii TaxID=61644 RepID=UPI0026EEA208|nr:hypothetical protein [Chromatium okenii]MBV5308987.1 hypothetical protein [Chromatium okenii]
MYTIYRLNTDELNAEWLESVKALFPHKAIEIAVTDAESNEQDETDYLLKVPANRARLLEALENVLQQRNLVSVNLNDLK